MNVKIVIGMTVSFLLGVGGGIFASKTLYEAKYEKLYQKDLADMKERYAKRPMAIPNIEASVKKPTLNDIESPMARSSIEKNPYEQAKRNYNLIRGGAVQPSEMVQPEQDADEGVTGPDEVEYIERKVDRTMPYEISCDEYQNEFDHHEKLSLFYYKDDKVLLDEDEELMEDPESIIGSDLSTLDRNMTMWVRNEPLCLDYEIVGLNASYAHSRGLDVEEPPRNLTPRERYVERKRLEAEQERERY